MPGESPLPRPVGSVADVIEGMALFSHKVANGVMQVILESGVAPMNLLGLNDPKSDIDLRSPAMLKCLKALHGTGKADDFRDDPALWQAQRARAVDLAAGRLYLVKLDEKDPAKTVKRMQEILGEMGHKMEETPRRASYHLKEGPGGPYLAVPGAYAMVALNRARAAKLNPEGLVTTPDEPLHRLVLKGSDAVALAKILENESHDNFVLNHTPEPVLAKVADATLSRPFLISARLGTELHLLRGNVSAVTDLMPKESYRPGANGSLLLRGQADEQKKALRRVQEAVPELDLREARVLADIPEDQPRVAIASQADKIVSARLESTVEVSAKSLETAKAFALKESALEPQQALGAAFILDQPQSLNADATGGGKTLMTAVGLHLKTAPGSKILVTCPPGIITQWVRCVDRFIPDIAGPEVLPENERPAWFERLPKSEQKKIAPAWERVRKRFVFLPESALESGVVVSKAAFKVKGDEKTTTAKNALMEIKSVLKEPISAVLVDEAHDHRNSGPKFTLLENIASGKARDLSGPIETVVLATATPMHRDAPDLFPLLRLLRIKKFQRMDVKEFCEEYCQRKITVGAGGERQFMAPVAPHGYGMLKEDKIAEIAEILGEKMISREKQQLAPDRLRQRIIASPMPYTPSETLGVSLDGFRQEGSLVPVPDKVASKLAEEGNYQARRMLLAHAKVAQTIQDAQNYLAANPGKKIVLFTYFINVAKALSAELKAAGVANHHLTGDNYIKDDGRGVATKQQLVEDFIESPSSSALVSTIGAGGTGIDGLHKAAQKAIFNDFTMVGGAQMQPEGRVHRTESEVIGPDAEAVHIQYQVADHPMDKHAWECHIARRHEMEFVRTQGLLQGLDSPETKATREMLADQFAEKVYAAIGEVPEIRPARDNAYLIESTMEEDTQMDLSGLGIEHDAPAQDETGLRIGGLKPPTIDEPSAPRMGRRHEMDLQG